MWTPLLSLALCATSALASNPKRGLISDVNAGTYKRDSNQLTKGSEVSWYYSFGQYPDSKFSSRYQFTMQQFGIDTTADSSGNNFKNLETLMGEVDKTRPKHLMTFLEPAISGISVPDAVAAWKKYIIPIRQKYPKMTVGSPSVINGDASLPWINEFIKTCPECKFDFVDVHYYWTYQEFKGEMRKWHKRFPKKPIWVSDLGFQDYNNPSTQCKIGDKTCVPKIKAMITWMDKTPWIKRYTFRGEFRRDKSGQPLWSFLNNKGNFTPLGKWYLGIA
ncbi:hypothetical protein C1H76_3602 [Elsinoe australis]|uniref:Asl1-like glycosyl hydrolase catalytic domain-containing protein n=1 Tax=Elsinoe australis TaxID=40998 RepID=A0A2P7YBT0_9PEZI|nr:hypothetical protein B9Z65_7311 [Elsinoe australis]TKX24191.1 hypothetical protein C1H76_3602 [Elsinoe australis]